MVKRRSAVARRAAAVERSDESGSDVESASELEELLESGEDRTAQPDGDEEEIEEMDVKELEALRQLRGEQRPRRVKAPQVNNLPALRQKLLEIALPAEWAWIERCSITSAHPVDVADVNDDLTREAAFYKVTTSAVKQALTNLNQSGVPYRRPRDFYAETVKSDSHMARVKEVLLGEKRRKESAMERRKEREMERYAKKTKAARLQAKAREQKQLSRDVDQFRATSAGSAGEETRHVAREEFERALSAGKRARSPSAAGRDGSRSATPNPKRLKKDAAYRRSPGKRSKSNDRQSTNEGFGRSRIGRPGAGGGGRGGGSRGGGSRGGGSRGGGSRGGGARGGAAGAGAGGGGAGGGAGAKKRPSKNARQQARGRK